VHYKSASSIDDTLDVFPCHGVGGMVGMIATAVFANEVGLVYGHWRTLGVHLAGLAGVAAFSFFGSLASTRSPTPSCRSACRAQEPSASTSASTAKAFSSRLLRS
jgi:ammonia channel protein AmtB